MGLLAFLKTQFVVHLLIGFVFVVSGLIINFIQLCTLVLWPVNKQLYRRLNCRLAYSLWSQLVMLLEWWSRTECTLFTDQATVRCLGKEHAVIILNHNFEIDFLCGWTMCERFGVLGSSKVLAKRELLCVPVIGWTWYFLEIVFCRRRWEEDRDTVVRGLQRLADYPEYMWVCTGRPPGGEGGLRAAADLSWLNSSGRLWRWAQQAPRSCCQPRRFPLEEIPLDEKEAAQWLHKLYQEKDALQEMYSREGVFPGQQFQPARRPWTLLNFLFWATVLLSPLLSFAVGVFASGSPLSILTFLGFVGAASFGVRRLIGVTEIEKGSSYGNQEFKKKE
ncbi:1-acyl-sn-glycerol-3-phosphate acyltransferase gamma [Pteropus vampyrus]|uniref:1-acyl-sn-glycerol-3-phosphate acyltransferase gamma n=1 Tax=Pteropus vampyrus TaxID=132908 RepID=A0A6P3R575_PTEVA|nr:1-acyl-sn-glycerol-3-phosphate acyltransferase gamma [Pteropus vampyrus]